MNLTMLGTGHAMVTRCYNTCFVIDDDGSRFMVDAGGGNTVISRLNASGIDWRTIRHFFVTHKHIDHLLGMIWMMRLICQGMNQGRYDGDAWIYGHDEVIALLRDIAERLLNPGEIRFIDDRLHLVTVRDSETRGIGGRRFTFFNIHSYKAKQFGFTMALDNGERLTCCGDEPLPPSCYKYTVDSKWLLHEAFCLFAERDIYHSYEKKHSTVKDACALAQHLGIQNLLLYHTEDDNLSARKALYTAEGAPYFNGRLWVPDDLECIQL